MKKVLSFLRIIDAHDGQLSLTNVAVLIVLIKLAIAPAVSITEIGALLIALANYTGKKFINQKNQEQTTTDNPELTELTKKFDEMTSQVSAMAMQAGIKKLNG